MTFKLSSVESLLGELNDSKYYTAASIRLAKEELAKGSDRHLELVVSVYMDQADEKIASTLAQMQGLIKHMRTLEGRLKESESQNRDCDEITADRDGLERKYQATFNQMTRLKAESDQYVRAHDALKIAQGQLQAQYDELEQQMAKLRPQLGELESLRKLNPMALKKEIEALNTTISKNKKKFDKKIGELESIANDRKDALDMAKAKLADATGEIVIDGLKGRQGVNFRVTYYGRKAPFNPQPVDDIVPLIQGLDWHMRVDTTTGLSVTVSINECLVPIFPFSTELKDYWPTELTDRMFEVIEQRMLAKNPELVKKKGLAEGCVFKDHESFGEAELDALQSAGIHTMLDLSKLTVMATREALLGTKLLRDEDVDALLQKLKRVYKSM